MAWRTKLLLNKISDNKVRIRTPKKKSLETLPENRKRRWWGEMCREAIPQISGENWEGPPADGGEVERWHNHLFRARWSILSVGSVSQERNSPLVIHYTFLWRVHNLGLIRNSLPVCSILLQSV